MNLQISTRPSAGGRLCHHPATVVAAPRRIVAAFDAFKGSFAITCPELSRFAADNLDSVRRAFAGATRCELGQDWLARPEAGFAPTLVRTGWRGESLLVFAELTDADICTRARTFNQRLWELGDTFEIFLRPLERACYFEFQISPNNQRLQLRFANSNAANPLPLAGSPENVVIAEDSFRSRTWRRPANRRWFVFAEIPARLVCDRNAGLEGCAWQFAFARYDYSRGRKQPVISSTSPHARPDFHRVQEWGVMNFRAMQP